MLFLMSLAITLFILRHFPADSFVTGAIAFGAEGKVRKS